MNIENRLKRFENSVNTVSTVCLCFPKVRTEIYRVEAIGELPPTKPALISEPVPTHYPNCRKPIEAERLVNYFTDKATAGNGI